MAFSSSSSPCRRPRINLILVSIAFPLLASSLLFSPSLAHGGEDASSSSSSEQPNLRSKSLILVKIYCLIIVFLATFLAGISPCFLRWNNGILVLGTQFAGGVFLGTATMHFLADSNATFQDRTSNDYPFAFMLACAGYLLTMLADCIIQSIFAKESKLTVPSKVDVEKVEAGDGDQTCKCEDDSGITPEAKHFVAATLASKKASLSDAILLILALCFHSVFEGIAIGIAESAADAWRALWTISLHKVFAAVAMGMALLRMMPARPWLQCALYSLAFGASTPAGVAIGIAIDATAQGPVADWIYAISMGLACGVFVYVAIHHLLVKGFEPPCRVRVDTPFFKLLAVALGVAVIAVVMIWD